MTRITPNEVLQLSGPPPNDRAWPAIKNFALDGVNSSHTIRAYDSALDDWRASYVPETGEFWSGTSVQHFRRQRVDRGLAASSINVPLAAIKKLAKNLAAGGRLSAEQCASMCRVPAVPSCGVRIGTWLTREQSQRLLDVPPFETLTGKRDRAMLAVFLGCGVRRSECAGLRLEWIQNIKGRWWIVDLVGKHRRTRTIEMDAGVKARIDEWCKAAGIRHGVIFCGLNRGGNISTSTLNPFGQAGWVCVKKYCEQAGVPIVTASDLRRTCAKLMRDGGASLYDVQRHLGHASLETTARYLGEEPELARISESLRLTF